MTSPIRFAGLLAAIIAVSGCGLFGGQFEEDIDCTDKCAHSECADHDSDFDFDSYAAGCGAAEERPQFCGVSDASDCVEPDFEIEEATIADIHNALENGDINCEWLTAEYQRRILWHDLYMEDGNPPLNAFVHLNEDALEAARTLDEYQACEEELTGPMHCVPFVIKTNFGSEEVPVTNGSLALEDTQPKEDAFTVERLRAAGGINLGSTTMDEFAAGAQGLSGRSGKTGNPYDTTRSSGGSSAGSAVAPAANLAMGGLGTDNCSSLTIPAAYNNLFTIRSSHQLVSTDGLFPSNALDAVAGPLTRTAEDMIIFFDEMAAFDTNYLAHCEEDVTHPDLEHEPDYTEAMNEDGFEGRRIGILEQAGLDPEDERLPFGAADAELEEHFEDFFGEIEDLGAELVHGVELDELDLDRRGSGSGWRANQFLEHTTGGATDFDELCETDLYAYYVFEERDDCINRGDQSAGQFENSLTAGLDDYRDRRAYVEDVMDDLDLDALVYPTDRRGAPRASHTATMCVIYSVTGLPTVTVPTGFDEQDLPIGMSFTARMYDDFDLLEMAYAYDQATDHRHPPEMPELDGNPPLDIEEFEQAHYEMGRLAFDEVIGHKDKQDLTASVFADIAYDVLDERGLDELID